MLGYFAPRRPELRMPKCEPGVPDKNGVVFYGPLLTGQVSAAQAIDLDKRRAAAAFYTPPAPPESGAGRILENFNRRRIP